MNITRKQLEEKKVITLEQYNNFNPKNLKSKGIINKENGLKLACFQFKSASVIDGTYWTSAEIINN